MEVASAVLALDACADACDLADEALLERGPSQQVSQQKKHRAYLGDALQGYERDSFGDSQRLRIAELDLGMPGRAQKVNVAVRRFVSQERVESEEDALVLLGRLEAFESTDRRRVVDLRKGRAEDALRMLWVNNQQANLSHERGDKRTALSGVFFSSNSHKSHSQSSNGVPS